MGFKMKGSPMIQGTNKHASALKQTKEDREWIKTQDLLRPRDEGGTTKELTSEEITEGAGGGSEQSKEVSLKDLPLFSEERKQYYKDKNWAPDHTTDRNFDITERIKKKGKLVKRKDEHGNLDPQGDIVVEEKPSPPAPEKKEKKGEGLPPNILPDELEPFKQLSSPKSALKHKGAPDHKHGPGFLPEKAKADRRALKRKLTIAADIDPDTHITELPEDIRKQLEIFTQDYKEEVDHPTMPTNVELREQGKEDFGPGRGRILQKGEGVVVDPDRSGGTSRIRQR